MNTNKVTFGYELIENIDIVYYHDISIMDLFQIRLNEWPESTFLLLAKNE